MLIGSDGGVDFDWRDYAARLDKSRSPRTDVKFLLASILQVSSTHIRHRVTLTEPQFQEFEQCYARLQLGEPLAYILGSWSFWGLTLKLNKHTLIPRADTECLVEAVLREYGDDSVLDVVDCGTGSGAIALALAHERPRWKILGIDSSGDCISCAEENRQSLGIPESTLSWCQGSWEVLPDLGRRFEVVVANPPYIDKDDTAIDQQVFAFEPHAALFAENEGYADLFKLINLSPKLLKSGGKVFLEHGYLQGGRVREFLYQRGFVKIETLCDFSNLPRVTIGCWLG